ncbi:hypothetical protein CQW23_10360 [Capsicum baccatum]|uniref:Uncharacterized protein n=1 Tax=Capsicum baccatum TaxID=33114 RepID=A0A2G2WZH3_CAPBA|nr:hypothetical protein CQW23_10360 [Capsicum baccatum]
MFGKVRTVLFKFEGNGFLCPYSTAASTHFLLNYLISSLGFSKQEAASASAKVGYRVKSFKNPDLALNFFKQTGFNDTHIKFLVSKYPKVLFYDVEKTLKPKLQCLSELGLSGSDLVKVILRDWKFLTRGLDTHIKPLINLLKNVLGNDENVVKVIKKSAWLISLYSCGAMEVNLNLLRLLGCSKDKIKNIVITCPRILNTNNKRLEDILHRVEKEVGVSPDSAMFLHILNVLASSSQDKVDTKFGIFKSFGWSDTDVLTMFQKLPYCVGLSDARIQTALTFLMKEVRYTSVYIASHPYLLSYSLEKRLIPRYEVWKLVNEKNLIKSRREFYTVMTWHESKFLEKYVLPVKAELPDLYDLYVKRIGK